MFKNRLKSRFIILFLASIFLIAPAIAVSNTKSCTYKCPQEPYDIGNPVSRGLQQISGLNFLATKYAESQIKKHLKRYANGNVMVNIDSFSALDLAAGKFKKLQINASEVNFENVYISSIQAESLCDFIHIKTDPVSLLEPLNIKFKGVVSENDLNKTVSNQKYLDRITKIKLSDNEFSFIKLNNPKVNLLKNRMVLSVGLWLSGTPENMIMPVEINAGIRAVNSEIQLSDIKLNAGILKLQLKIPPQVYEIINPVLYNLNDLVTQGSPDKKINFNKVAIDNDKIEIEGSLWLPKSNEKNTINNKT